MGATERRKPRLWRKMRESGAHRDTHKENTFPKPLGGQMREADFYEFLQTAGLKD